MIAFAHLFLSFSWNNILAGSLQSLGKHQGHRGRVLLEYSLTTIMVFKASVWPVLKCTCVTMHLASPDLWQTQIYLSWFSSNAFPLISCTFQELPGETQLNDFCLHVSCPKHTNFLYRVSQDQEVLSRRHHSVQAQVMEYIWFYTAASIWLFNF